MASSCSDAQLRRQEQLTQMDSKSRVGDLMLRGKIRQATQVVGRQKQRTGNVADAGPL